MSLGGIRDWKNDFEKFESFLKQIDLEKYSYLRRIKTVEQDLPRGLLPLKLFAKHYWENPDWSNPKDYEDVFKEYWDSNLHLIYDFIKKYFYGCSLWFVEEGFKARLYRIWMSILTQFHFQYLWNKSFPEKVKYNPDLDARGIDCIVDLNNLKVAIQIKKVSHRREASSRRFSKRQQRFADVSVEIPYLVIDPDEVKQRIRNPRTKKKDEYKRMLIIFENNFRRFDNGFVVFRDEFVQHVRRKVEEVARSASKGRKVTYDEILEW